MCILVHFNTLFVMQLLRYAYLLSTVGTIKVLSNWQALDTGPTLSVSTRLFNITRSKNRRRTKLFANAGILGFGSKAFNWGCCQWTFLLTTLNLFIWYGIILFSQNLRFIGAGNPYKFTVCVHNFSSECGVGCSQRIVACSTINTQIISFHIWKWDKITG